MTFQGRSSINDLLLEGLHSMDYLVWMERSLHPMDGIQSLIYESLIHAHLSQVLLR